MEKTFTTEPRTRRHGQFVSSDRCRTFMEYMWDKQLRVRVSPKTLYYEFIQCFGTNDKRTVEKYIGRSKRVIRKSGRSMARMNRQTGTTSQFYYAYQHKVEKKTGLLEQLGYLTWSSNESIYRLNHELLPYYTEQTILEVPPVNPPQESVFRECSQGTDVSTTSSIDNLRVCSSVQGDMDRVVVVDGNGEAGKRQSIDDGERREREYNDHTRKSMIRSKHAEAVE